MSPDEVRKARIANAKAKSAAMKVAKAARESAGVAAPAPTAAAPAARAATAPVAALPTNIPEPQYIDITDDMSPDEVRKARIANSKAKSAYNKALKAAGFAPEAVASGVVEAPAAIPAQPTPAPAAVVSTIPEPQYIEITEDMAPEEIRKARVENSKMKSAYNKALKAAGIDPQALASSGEAAFKQPTAGPTATSESPQAATPAEPTPTTMYEPVAVPANIAKPDYIEITEDMSPEAIRQARIHNSKARSQYNKALKAAGIDPQTVS
jgi:Arc/MetJ family transcription regulator